MQSNIPLAERLRPHTLDEYIGQTHLVGPQGVFRKFLETGNVPSFILWGPPGVGKTTLARLVATALERKLFTLSAVTSGVKEVREVIEQARKSRFFNAPSPFLFIDEIHRFNKSQQDSLLGAVEQGVITLIGATTENPSFEVISPLLSRCQVYVLKAMESTDLQQLLDRAIATDPILKERGVKVIETEALFRFSGGDARKLLNIIDILCNATEGEIVISDQQVTDCLQQNIALYDKNGEQHYDVISAFIKSVRGSDPNAAIYYLARMLSGGEDPKFIARRLVILACNTASAKALRTIQQVDLPQWDPEKRVLGVIRPSVEALNTYSQNGHVGILATRGTVASGSYPIEVGKLYGEERFRITQRACPMWVPLVENNELDGEGAIYFVRKYIQELLGTDPEIDTIILGCTHYPLLRPLIARFVPSRVKIIGQGQIVAGSLADYLKRHPEIDRRLGKDSRRSYLTTEKTELFDRMAGLFLKEEISSQRIFMC